MERQGALHKVYIVPLIIGLSFVLHHWPQSHAFLILSGLSNLRDKSKRKFQQSRVAIHATETDRQLGIRKCQQDILLEANFFLH